METRAELAVLRSYVENQAILEQGRAGQQGLFMDPYFYFFIRLLLAFFSFSCQNKIKLCYNRL